MPAAVRAAGEYKDDRPTAARSFRARQERRKEEPSVKWHRIFAWAGLACMALCVYTGKKHV